MCTRKASLLQFFFLPILLTSCSYLLLLTFQLRRSTSMIVTHAFCSVVQMYWLATQEYAFSPWQWSGSFHFFVTLSALGLSIRNGCYTGTSISTFLPLATAVCILTFVQCLQTMPLVCLISRAYIFFKHFCWQIRTGLSFHVILESLNVRLSLSKCLCMHARAHKKTQEEINTEIGKIPGQLLPSSLMHV